MELRAAGLVLGLLIIIGGVFMISLIQEAGEPGISPSGGIADTSEENRPYFWHGVFLIIAGLVVTVFSYIKEESK